jgi:hypothetical protein
MIDKMLHEIDKNLEYFEKNSDESLRKYILGCSKLIYSYKKGS